MTVGEYLDKSGLQIYHNKVKQEITNLESQLEEKTTQINNLNTYKVEKVVGKGLSTNDYDNTEKAEVAKVKNKVNKIEAESKYAKKAEITNTITPKGNSNYASLPTTGNTIGDYYYCSDGDGTHGKGNYVWNGTAWFFGGTGDEGFSKLADFSRKRTSKNQFNGSFDESGYIDDSGANKTSTNFKRTKDYYEIDYSNTSRRYMTIIPSVQMTGFQINIYDDSNNVLMFKSCNNMDYVGFVLPNNATKYRMYVSSSFTGNISVTLEDTTIYDDYKEEIIPILKNNVIPDSCKNGNVAKSRISDKIIINFGDSIFGNYQDETSISGKIATKSGATVYNCGFGGCRMTSAPESAGATEYAWSPYSMVEIAEAITTGDWTRQDDNISYGTTPGNTIPSYFANTIAVLKSIDFTKVDIVTVAYGTNDYTYGSPIDNTDDELDKYSYLTALKYATNLIKSKYPNIKILVITPIWRCWSDGTESDTRDYKGKGTLLDYVIALETRCKKLRLPVLNSYENLSFDFTNRAIFYDDYTHLNGLGRDWYADIICGKLCTMF